MSLPVVRMVFEAIRAGRLAALDQQERWTLVIMADRADHAGGNIFPSIAELARVTGLLQRTLQRALETLENKKLGLDRPIVVRESQGHRGKNARWRIDLEALQKGVIRSPISSAETAERVSNPTGKGVKSRNVSISLDPVLRNLSSHTALIAPAAPAALVGVGLVNPKKTPSRLAPRQRPEAVAPANLADNKKPLPMAALRKKKRTKRVATGWPWPEMTAELRKAALDADIVDPEQVFELFHLRVDKLGLQFVNWFAAFVDYCRNPYQDRFRRQNGASASGPPADAGKAIAANKQAETETAVSPAERAANLELFRNEQLKNRREG